MATYYVGAGGNNGNAGTTWALRRLTLTSIETLVAAGDTVYVGPGVYRELLTCTTAGSSGSPITYVADVLGENTDGVGGQVRITGSDNDTTVTRANCISINSRNYRTFRGFTFDSTSAEIVTISTATNWIVEDCVFSPSVRHLLTTGGSSGTLRRCMFLGSTLSGVRFAGTANSLHVVENCIFIACGGLNFEAIGCYTNGGVTVRNCTITGSSAAIYSEVTSANPVVVNNCIIFSCKSGVEADSTASMTENYNNFYVNTTDRTNVNTGANSSSAILVFAPPILRSGYNFMPLPFELGPYDSLRAKAGTGFATTDLRGITRPATSGKGSWGALQFTDASQDTANARTGAAAVKLADAGSTTWRVPVTNTSTTISAYVKFEANYAGTKPQLIIRQPGQSDTTVTATGTGAYEQLTSTITPAATTDFVDVLLVSNNTATSGSYAVYFDDFAVT